MHPLVSLFRRPVLRSREFRHYLCGQGGVLLGAMLTGASESLWPLALGASASLMLTASLVRRLRTRSNRRC